MIRNENEWQKTLVCTLQERTRIVPNLLRNARTTAWVPAGLAVELLLCRTLDGAATTDPAR